jgi:hypothetical protein
MKPNVSELCAVISAALDMDLIMQGRAAVVNALGQRRSRRKVTEAEQQPVQSGQSRLLFMYTHIYTYVLAL